MENITNCITLKCTSNLIQNIYNFYSVMHIFFDKINSIFTKHLYCSKKLTMLQKNVHSLERTHFSLDSPFALDILCTVKKI